MRCACLSSVAFNLAYWLKYVRQATGGGAGADGLLQRFGLMVYPDISPDWKEVDRYPDSTAREAVNMLAERLDNLNTAEIGAEVDLYGGVPFLRFDDAAQVLFSEWRASTGNQATIRRRASGDCFAPLEIPEANPLAGTDKPPMRHQTGCSE